MNNIPRTGATQARCSCLVAAYLLLWSCAGFAQTAPASELAAKIRAVLDTAHAKIGVGISGLDFTYSLKLNDRLHFPMQSVYKFPLALAVLARVDSGKLSLRQNIHIPKQSLDTDTWGPLVRDYPRQDIDMPLADVLRYAISKSDNNACDVLFRLMGGTGVVDSYVRHIGITGIAIKATEAEMSKAWPIQYTNWCRPAAMLRLLRLFYQGRLLSGNNTALLTKWMTESENAPDRIKGLLPADAVVAHKTGTSGTNDQGIRAAINDVGIVTLPDGRHYALVVYVSDYKGDVARGAHIIAIISRVVWDYFTETSHHQG